MERAHVLSGSSLIPDWFCEDAGKNEEIDDKTHREECLPTRPFMNTRVSPVTKESVYLGLPVVYWADIQIALRLLVAVARQSGWHVIGRCE